MIAARIAEIGNTAERVALIHAIADAMARYRPVNGPSGWIVFDMAANAPTPARYDSKALAKRGARLMAACDIVEMLEAVPT